MLHWFLFLTSRKKKKKSVAQENKETKCLENDELIAGKSMVDKTSKSPSD